MKKGKALEKLKLRERNKVKEVSKYIISAFLVVLFLHGRMCVVAQSPTIQNDEVLFSLVFTSYSVLDSIYSPMKFHVLIENHPKQMILDHYAQMDTSMLFSLLDNPKYDWTTNLVLYNVYDVDASMFFAFDIKTREDWINYFQDKDTTMWHDFFKHRKGTQSIKVE